jgi:hypothetical protein
VDCGVVAVLLLLLLRSVLTMLDVEEYAKQKGIPLGAIPVEALKKFNSDGGASPSLRQQPKGESKAEAFKLLCTDTKALLEKCGTTEGGVSFLFTVHHRYLVAFGDFLLGCVYVCLCGVWVICFKTR